MDPHNMEARRLFATLHLRLGSLIPARQAFDSLIDEAFARQDYWLAESLLREYLAAGPRCVPYLEKLGLIHQDKGEVTEAVEQYGKAIDILVEDPDPDNPNHASQLYEKIKDLAPASFVATRVAGYFDAQTGALAARSSDDAEFESSVSDVGSGLATESEAMAETGGWGETEEPLLAEEAGIPVDNSEVSPAENGVEQREEAPGIADDMSASDQTMAVSDAEPVESEPASIMLDESTGFVLQQTETLEDPPQEILQETQETVEQVGSDSMPWEEVQETIPEIPSQVTTESDEAISFISGPDQTSPATSPDSAKGGAFSWDSVFKNVWNKNNGTVSTASTPGIGTPQIGAIPLSQPNTVKAPSASAPMPWDQVEDSTIRISPGQTEEGIAEPPIEQAILSDNSAETMTWADQEPAAAQDRPMSLIQPDEETTEPPDFSINPSLPEPSARETESPSDGMVSIPSATELLDEGQEDQRESFSFAFSSEEPKPVEEASSETVMDLVDQSTAGGEAASLSVPDENVSFSVEGEAGETPLESYDNGLEQAAIPDEQTLPGNAIDLSPHIAHHISDEPVHHSSTQDQAKQDEWSKPSFIEARTPLPDPPPQLEDAWSKPEESTRFVGDSPAVSVEETAQKPFLWREPKASGLGEAAVSVGSVPFIPSSDRAAQAEPREHATRPRPRRKGPGALSRIGATISSFIGSCFSTTRAIVMSLIALAVLSCIVAALGVGAVGITWMIMEEAPSPAYQSFTAGPEHTLSDSNKNGYGLLMEFDEFVGQSPDQSGDERRLGRADADHSLACLGSMGDGGKSVNGNVSEKILSGWFRGSDPVGQFTANQGAIGRWASQGERMLGRYRQWQTLPFEDWGYGRAVAPPCAAISFAHRLYVAEGFAQHTDIGIDRLEGDMEAWRAVLAQAKTLPVKVLAIQAVRDDVTVVSGLLARPDFDGKYIGRLSHMLRPLNQEELSIRWPMQSELAWAAKTFDAQLKAEKQKEQPFHAAVASALPLPSQRRLNSYAAYYEAANQASEEGRHGALPKLAGFIKSPASTVMDYFANPIENVIGLDPLPTWDIYNGLVVDADAHLRLASLQAWIRRGWQDTELLSRIAKAGQTFYDPYTGLPMLVNLKNRLLYSVGRDLKDQDGDPQSDVVVAIPGNPAFK